MRDLYNKVMYYTLNIYSSPKDTFLCENSVVPYTFFFNNRGIQAQLVGLRHLFFKTYTITCKSHVLDKPDEYNGHKGYNTSTLKRELLALRLLQAKLTRSGTPMLY